MTRLRTARFGTSNCGESSGLARCCQKTRKAAERSAALLFDLRRRWAIGRRLWFVQRSHFGHCLMTIAVQVQPPPPLLLPRGLSASQFLLDRGLELQQHAPAYAFDLDRYRHF